jgi:hypothetical protein
VEKNLGGNFASLLLGIEEKRVQLHLLWLRESNQPLKIVIVQLETQY